MPLLAAPARLARRLLDGLIPRLTPSGPATAMLTPSGPATAKELWPPTAVPPSSSPRRPGKYDAQLIALAEGRPGITVAQAAQQIGVDATALYPVIRRLEQHGRLRKLGRELHPPR